MSLQTTVGYGAESTALPNLSLVCPLASRIQFPHLHLHNVRAIDVQSSTRLTANLVATRTSSDVISGQFQENSGSPVSFYILSSAQFAAFQAQTSFNYLYGIVNVASGSFSYTFPLQDTYEIVFRHGAGLINNYETVNFQRTYQTHISSRLQLGLVFVVFGAASLVVASRPERPKKDEAPLDSEAPTPTPLVGGPTPAGFLKACPKCGAENPLAAEKCRACSAKI